MNAEEMTAEQLMELAREKGGPDTGAAEHEVDGVRFKVRPERLRSWTAVKMISQLRDGEVDLGKMLAMMDFVCFATDLDEGAILDHCGGEDAPFDDVMVFLADVSKAIFPKN